MSRHKSGKTSEKYQNTAKRKKGSPQAIQLQQGSHKYWPQPLA